MGALTLDANYIVAPAPVTIAGTMCTSQNFICWLRVCGSIWITNVEKFLIFADERDFQPSANPAHNGIGFTF
jgi:hypothetical protein